MNDEERANPYNSNKEWQEGDDAEFVSSDSLFRPEPKRKDPEQSANLNAEDNPYKTRYDELKKHHDQKVRDLKQEVTQARAELESKTPKYTPPKTAEEIEAFKEQNPEIYAVLETEIHNRTSETAEKVQRLDEREKKILIREAQAEIRRQHPDFDEVKVDPAFHSWAETQDDDVKVWIYENPYDGAKAAKAISLYKFEKGIKVVQQNDQPDVTEDAATLLPTRSSGSDKGTHEKKIWRESEIKAMSMATYDKYEEEINVAMSEGRVQRG